MSLRTLLVLAALLPCALWPQGIVLCTTDDGHAEFEIAGDDCCPTESGDCQDCVDTTCPELTSAPAPVALAAPEISILTAPPAPAFRGYALKTPPGALSPERAFLETVVLVV